MSTSPEDAEITTEPTTTTTTEKFDLVKKYLHDWPPEVGVDVSDAATYGIAFLVLIGLLFTFCIALDIDFFRRKLKLIRQMKREKDLERLLGIKEQNKPAQNKVAYRGRPGSGVRKAGITRDKFGAPVVLDHAEDRRFTGLIPPTILPYHVRDDPPAYSKSVGKEFRAV